MKKMSSQIESKMKDETISEIDFEEALHEKARLQAKLIKELRNRSRNQIRKYSERPPPIRQ